MHLYEEDIKQIHEDIIIYIMLSYCKGWIKAEKDRGKAFKIMYLFIHVHIQQTFLESALGARRGCNDQMKSLASRNSESSEGTRCANWCLSGSVSAGMEGRTAA